MCRMVTQVARKVLARAAAKVGGVQALADRLKLNPRVVAHFIEGHESVPDAVLLAAIDVILEDLPNPPPAGQLAGRVAPPKQIE
jgi:hypothetical protein